MLDPATVQILFADLQPPIVARSMTNPPESLSCAASVLARCARLFDLPVHHSVVPAGGKAPEVLPDLAKETDGAPQFARMTADPFLDPHTREAIDAVKRPVLVIAGCATEAVVLRAALSALQSDYQVQVPVDACGGLSARTEDAALRQIEAAGGMGRLVQQQETAGADRKHSAGRSRSALLCADGGSRHGGVTQPRWPPANPGRFTCELDCMTVVAVSDVLTWQARHLKKNPLKIGNRCWKAAGVHSGKLSPIHRIGNKPDRQGLNKH